MKSADTNNSRVPTVRDKVEPNNSEILKNFVQIFNKNLLTFQLL